eukprot:441474_1
MGNKLSSKKRKKYSPPPPVNNAPRPNFSEIQSMFQTSNRTNNGIWSWDNNGKWVNFEKVTSKQIDTSLRTQWMNTSANPLIFPITAGAFFNMPYNVNTYSVYVYLNEGRTKINNVYQQNKTTNFRRQLRRTPPFVLSNIPNNISNNISNNSNVTNNNIYNQLLTMGFDQTAAHQAAINCKNIDTAIEFVSTVNDKSLKADMIDDYDMDMVDYCEDNTIGMDISKFQYVDTETQCLVFGYIRITFARYNYPDCINKICAIFYYEKNKIKFSVGSEIDGRDRWGKWYLSVIKYHKPKTQKLKDSTKKKYKLSKVQEKDCKKLEKLEAVYVHYKAWEEKWDEWIFIEENTICNCNGPCYVDKAQHRLSAPNTQSRNEMKHRKRKLNKSHHIGSEVKGKPIALGCAGLVNLGSTCFMNSIVQCISNTPELLPYFLTRKYELDVNSSNNRTGMKGKFVRQFGGLLIDIWSNNYKAIKPILFRKSVAQHAPQFNGFKFHDAEKFLNFLLTSLNEELNSVKVEPYIETTETKDKSDKILAELSWKQHLAKNKSKIVDLFHGQRKSYIQCDECKKESIIFQPYSYLSLPLPVKNEKSLIVDVFHRKQANNRKPNKPIRHVYHVTKTDTVKELAKVIANEYETQYQFVLFYENWNMKVAQEYTHDIILGDISHREAIACYILKDWNKEFTAQEIKDRKLQLCLGKVCHSQPLIYRAAPVTNTPLFGMPFVVSFLQYHTRKQINKIIYKRLHLWLGSDILIEPPILIKLLKVKIKNELQSEEEIVRPSTEEWTQHELEWDIILNNLPFVLRWMPHASFSLKQEIPESIPCDDIVFMELLMSGLTSIPVVNANINILIEWKPEYYDRVKTVLNKVVVDAKYSKWKKQMLAGDDPNALSIYDCMNKFCQVNHSVDCVQCKKQYGNNVNNSPKAFRSVAGIPIETAELAVTQSVQTDTQTAVSKPMEMNVELPSTNSTKKKRFQNGIKKMDIWSFPEILVIHLDRFPVINMDINDGRGKKWRLDAPGNKITTLIECPVVGLDLSGYGINNNMDVKPIYDLYATCQHARYHYSCVAKNSEDNKWYHFDDDSVQLIEDKQAISRATYILFYKKRH